MQSIAPPLTLAEATALAGVLGPDNCFGLAWTVVHLIESAPGWSVEHVPSGSSPLLDKLRGRASNAQDGASHGVGASQFVPAELALRSEQSLVRKEMVSKGISGWSQNRHKQTQQTRK